MDTSSANQCRYSRGLSSNSGERTRPVPRVRERLAEMIFFQIAEGKFAMARASSPAREARALPRISAIASYPNSLHTFFEGSGFAAQMGERFAGEMQ